MFLEDGVPGAADLTDVPVDVVAKVTLGAGVVVELPSQRVWMGRTGS